MANNTIYTNTGTYGSSSAANIGPLMQGQAGVVMRFTVAGLDGTAINLTGLTITGTITNNQTNATGSLAGAIALVTPASGIFSWTTDADDVGTAGEFTLIFTIGSSMITLPAHLSIVTNPSADTTFAAALVGVTVAEAAWLSAALAAVPDAANLPDPTGATDGHVWTADGADGAGWEAAATGGASDVDDLTTTTGNSTEMVRVAAAGGLEYRTPAQVLSDIGAAATSSLASYLPLAGGTMNGAIAYSGSSPLLSFTPSADAAHAWMEYAPQITPTLKWRWTVSQSVAFPGDPARNDVTSMWGYNQAANGGVNNSADGAFYVQMENHYWPAGAPAAQYEYHLNAFTADSGTYFRPFQINVRKDLSLCEHGYVGDSFAWQDRSSNSLLGLTTGQNIRAYRNLDVDGTIRAYTSMVLQAAGGATPHLTIAPATGKIEFTGNPTSTDLYFYNWRKMNISGLTEYNLTSTDIYLWGNAYVIRAVAGTNTPQRVFTCWRTLTTGTAADGIGANFDFLVQTSGGSSTAAGRVRGAWAVATTGAQIGEVALEAYDYNSSSVARTGVVVRASAAGVAHLGFYGVTPTARQLLATGAGASVDDVITALQTLGLVKQS